MVGIVAPELASVFFLIRVVGNFTEEAIWVLPLGILGFSMENLEFEIIDFDASSISLLYSFSVRGFL